MVILVTGASGFLGRHLCAELQRRHPKSRLVSTGSQPADIVHFEHIVCDLTNKEQTEKMIRKIKPTWVFHLAGIARVSNEISFETYFRSNFLTTNYLIDSLGALASPVRLFFSSTVHVYGNAESPMVDESHDSAPAHPYGFSKYLCEKVLAERTLAEAQPLQVIVGRLYSCIGPGQPAGFFISDFLQNLKSTRDGEELRTHGALDGWRDFVDVRDAVSVFIKLMETPLEKKFEVFNIGSGQGQPLEKVVQLILATTKRKVSVVPGASNNSFSGIRTDVTKLTQAIAPQFRSLDETIKDMWGNTLNGIEI